MHCQINTTGSSTVWDAWGTECQLQCQLRWVARAWTIWNERNRYIFQDERKNSHALRIELETYITQWGRAYNKLDVEQNMAVI
jgi:hypothetical protein